MNTASGTRLFTKSQAKPALLIALREALRQIHPYAVHLYVNAETKLPEWAVSQINSTHRGAHQGLASGPESKTKETSTTRL